MRKSFLFKKIQSLKRRKINKRCIYIKRISNFLFTILIPVWGIFLTCNGNNISKASLRLQENDNTQQVQIEQLSDMLSKHDTTINRLVTIISELKDQNRMTFAQNELIGQQNYTIQSQLEETNTIAQNSSKQIGLHLRMIQMNLRDSSDNIIANKMRLYSTISQIKDTLNYFSHFYEIFETDTNYVLSDSLKNRVNGIIKHVKFLLTSENGNLYLKENKIVKAFWEGFLANINRLDFLYNIYDKAAKNYQDRVYVNSKLVVCYRRFCRIEDMINNENLVMAEEYEFPIIE